VISDAPAQFTFHALRPDGSAEDGELTAKSESEARAALALRGLLPLSLLAHESVAARRSGLPAGDLAVGLRVLADLLKSGLPIAKALQTLHELAPPGWKAALPGISEAVRQGRGLAAALDESPVEFPPLVVGIIRAGEAGSGVAEAVRRAAAIAEETAETRAAILSALAYPAVVAIAGFLSVGIMVGVVLPKFAVILGDLGQALPPSTRLVMSIATGARQLFIPVSLGLVVAVVAVRGWMATPSGRRRVHSALIATPLIGTIRHAAATASAASSLGALLASGVAIRAAMLSAAESSGDAEVAGRITRAREQVITGHGLALSLAGENAFTPTAIRLTRAGEESGQLPGMLEHAARLERDRAQRLVKAAVRFLEPMLLLVFAGIVGLVAAALLQAVYSVRPG
jgi:type II secretory pathway component PulF